MDPYSCLASCLSFYAFFAVPCSLVTTCLEMADHGFCINKIKYSCVFGTFLYGIPGYVRYIVYLMVSIIDLCILLYSELIC